MNNSAIAVIEKKTGNVFVRKNEDMPDIRFDINKMLAVVKKELEFDLIESKEESASSFHQLRLSTSGIALFFQIKDLLYSILSKHVEQDWIPIMRR